MDFVRSAKYIVSAAILLAGLALGSCTEGDTPDNVELAAASPSEVLFQSHSVRFFAGELELKCEDVDEGEFPQPPEVESPEGTRFGGWVDEKGRRAEPGATPVYSDASYTAVFMPLLDGEGPYLFTDSAGLLKPDAVLDSEELLTALNALAGEEAKAYFPEEFMADDAITAEELRKVLSAFFTYDEMDRVILGFEDVDKLSKAQFAIIMNRLLGRATDEPCVVAESAYRIPDVSLERSDYTELMEAAVEHSHSGEGRPWRNVSLPALYEEGYVLVEGCLYMADSKGIFLSDTVLGSLTFAYDGRCTSGDATLDSCVRAILADVSETNPEAKAGELLEAVYDYCCGSFGVSRGNIYDVGNQSWAIAEAIAMFEVKSGSSYSFAAAFWALARGLGYEATAVNGAVGSELTPHAWVEIEIDGENYIFDPALESGAVEGIDAGRDMFMKSEAQVAMYRYFKG